MTPAQSRCTVGRRTAAATLAFVLLVPAATVADDQAVVGGSVKPILDSIQLENLEGDVQALSAHLGPGPLLIDFWATWCKPCLVALPELEALYDDLGPRGLRVLGINEDGPRNAAKVKPFVRSHGYSFPVVLDLNREAQRRLNAVAMPTSLLLDASGKVVHVSYGYRKGDYAKLRGTIEELLPQEADD